jgi:valyl-tRNA synthetase
MKAIHPFMPFISEEIYHVLWGDKLDKPCVISEYPQSQNSATEFDSDLVLQAVSEVRNLRAQKQLSPKIELKTWMVNADPSINAFSAMLEKLANIQLQTTNRHEGNFIMLLVKQTEIWIEIEQEINIEEECAKIEKEIGYLKGFLKSIDAKLLNEKFMANAKPDVIEREKQKYDDAQSKINNFEIQLKALRS